MARGFFLGIIFTLIALAVAAYAAIATGAIPANADATPGAIENFIAGTDLVAVLNKEAPKEPNPVALTDGNLISGIQLYDRRCGICHGGPAGNASPTTIARGEYPQPPQFGSDGVEDDPEGWTFWKIKHGIRWSGMPSWKDVLNDQQIWTITLFLKHMDKLPPAADAAWKQPGRTTAAPAPASPSAAAPSPPPTASPAPPPAPPSGGQ